MKISSRWTALPPAMLLTAGAFAQTGSEAAHNPALRDFNTQAMDGYLADSAFGYIHLSPQGMSLWDRFWLWVFSHLAQLLNNPNSDTITDFLWWAFVIAVVIGAAWLLIRMQYGSVFSPANANTGSGPYFTSGNKQTNYEQLLKDAINAGDLKLAIRYLYMKGLIALDNRKLIKMRNWKTGADYLHELPAESPHRTAFVRLKQVFEYTWYGEFEPDTADLQLCRDIVDELQKAKP